MVSFRHHKGSSLFRFQEVNYVFFFFLYDSNDSRCPSSLEDNHFNTSFCFKHDQNDSVDFNVPKAVSRTIHE